MRVKIERIWSEYYGRYLEPHELSVTVEKDGSLTVFHVGTDKNDKDAGFLENFYDYKFKVLPGLTDELKGKHIIVTKGNVKRILGKLENLGFRWNNGEVPTARNSFARGSTENYFVEIDKFGILWWGTKNFLAEGGYKKEDEIKLEVLSSSEEKDSSPTRSKKTGKVSQDNDAIEKYKELFRKAGAEAEEESPTPKGLIKPTRAEPNIKKSDKKKG